MWIERGGASADAERIALIKGLTWEIYHVTPKGKRPLSSPIRLKHRSTPAQENVTQEWFMFLGRQGRSNRGCHFDISTSGKGCGLGYPTKWKHTFDHKPSPSPQTPASEIVDKTMLVSPEEYDQARRAGSTRKDKGK